MPTGVQMARTAFTESGMQNCANAAWFPDWGIRYQIPPGVLSQIRNRCTTVHSYVLFTGYQPLFIRGEMRAFQVMPEP